MQIKNVNALERLSLFCHICGLFTIFLGLLVSFIDYRNSNFNHIQVGIFIFITGYAFVKISQKVSSVIEEERWLLIKAGGDQKLTNNQK